MTAPPSAPTSNGLTADQIALIKRTIGKDLTDAELDLFIYQCKRTGLDPLVKQIYPIKRAGRMTIQVGIDGFRLIAERTGRYAGQLGPFFCGDDGVWLDVWLKAEPPAAARIAILRKDFSEPLWSVARFASFVADNLWRKMPEVMIAKVAEMAGLRRAFPQELSGIYGTEEMQQADAPTLTVVEPLAEPPSVTVVEAGPERSDPPKGFESWLLDMQAAADEGTKALQTAWNASRVEHRRYLATAHGDVWAALKEKAAGVKVPE
jgi:phage recombination protein Bet